MYYPWIRQLELANVEMRTVQYPGREDRINETPIASCASMVDALADDWSRIAGLGSCALFGHSMGAAIAYELSGELRRRQAAEAPCHLFISGRNPPHVKHDLARIHHLPDKEFIERLIGERGAKLPPEILENSEMLAVVTRTLRADYTVSETYKWKPKAMLQTPVSIFGGYDDPWTTPESLAEWKRYFGGTCRLRMIRGDHFFHQSAGDEVISSIVADLGALANGGGTSAITCK